jgi:TP901 family phage tail tape measure protein
MPNNTVAIKLQVKLTGLVGVTKLNTALEALMKSSGGLGRSARNNKAVWEAQNRALENAAKATQNIAKAQTTTQRATNGTTAAVKKLTAAERLAYSQEVANLKIAQKRADAMKTLGGRLRMYEQDVDSLFRAGYRLQMLGSDLQMIGKRIFDFVGGISESFGEFEFMALRAGGAMNVVSESSERGVADMGDLQGAILNATRELRLFDPTEVAEATYYWGSTTGQTVDTIEKLETAMKGINPIMKVAAMTNTSYETAIKGVYSIIVQYGKSLDDVADVTQKLFKATNVTAAEFPDLINSFKMVGPIAKENGVTFEQMVEQFGRLADVGIRGTMVGRAFRQLFIQLARPAPKAVAALNELWEATEQFQGRSYKDMAFPGGQFIGVDKYVDLLAEAMKDLTQAERNHIIATITTANELPVLTALISRQTDKLNGLGKGWDASKYAVKDAADYFNQSWDKLSGSWKGLTSAIQNGVEIIRIQLGGRLADIARPVLEEFRKLLDRISEWMNNPANAGIIDFFIKLAAAVGALSLGIGVLASFAGGLIAASAAASLLYRSFSPLFGFIASWAGVVAGVATSIIRNLDYIVEGIGKVGDNFREAFGESGEAAEGLGRAFSGLMKIMAPFFDFLVRSVVDLVVAFSGFVKWLSKIEIAMQAVSVVAQVLAALFAARMIGAVLGLSKAFTFFGLSVRKIEWNLAKARLSLAMFNASLATTGSVMTKTKVAAAALGSTIKTGLKAVLGGGWIGVAIAAFLLLYDVFPPLQEAVKGLGNAFGNLRKEVEGSIGDGERGQNAAAWYSQMVEDYIKATGMLEDYINNGKHGPILHIEGGGLFDFAGYDDPRVARQVADKVMGPLMDALRGRVEEAGYDWQEYMDAAFTLKGTVGNVEEMEQVTTAFFQTINGQAKSGDEGLQGFRETLKFLGKDQLWIDKNSQRVWNNFSAHVQRGVDAAQSAVDGFDSSPLDKVPFNSDDQRSAEMFSQAQSLIGQGGAQTGIGQAMLQQIVSNRSKYGPRLNAAIDDFINDLIGSYDTGMSEFGEELGNISEEAVEVGSQQIIDNVSKLRDLPAKIAQIMKDSFTMNHQMAGIFTDFLSGTISKGFRNTHGQFIPEAQLFASETMATAMEQLEAYSQPGVMPEPDLIAMATTLKNAFRRQIPTALPKEVPTEQRQQLMDYMTQVWAILGKPVPQYVLDRIWSTSVDAGEHGGDGFVEGVENKGDDAETAAGTVKSDAVRKLKPGELPKKYGEQTTGNFKTGLANGGKPVKGVITSITNKTKGLNTYTDNSKGWGMSLVSNFAAGMKARAYLVAAQVGTITAYIAASMMHSTPKEGPLKDDDVWGKHFVENIAGGINKGLPELRRSVDSVTNAMAMTASEMQAAQSGVTIESASRRSIDVNIKVTSPDGSVDRVQTAQLQAALMSSDLVLSLEHMATVG